MPENYTVVEQGILFGTDSGLAQESALVIDGLNVRKGQSSSTFNNGVYSISVSVGNNTGTTIYARGYMIIRNNQTGNIDTIYTSVEYGSYDSLTSSNK